jgi:flavin reductase (DIM6/NTAB) family NADH-FMN oxidoreductase RutF/DNA-binding FadR family transcriptional regulator
MPRAWTREDFMSVSQLDKRQIVDQQIFRDVVGRFASGVTVITTASGDKRFGTTASAMSSLSMDPPMILICLNKTSETGAAVLKAGTFAVNILAKGQEHLASQFAVKGDDKFAHVDVTEGVLGAPLLNGTLATMQCRTVETVTGGTHTVFLAEVIEAEARDLEPLTYFRGKFGRLEAAMEAEAYLQLRDWVLRREIPAGERLDLAALRESLHVDLEHLSTALVKLSMENLVTRQDDGAFVTTPITTDVIDGLFDARCAIEVGIADAHVAHITPEQVESLQDIAVELEHIVNEEMPDIDRFLNASHAYHAQFVGLSGCQQLIDAFSRLGISGVWRNAIADLDWWNLFDVRYHQQLTDALKNRSVEDAKKLIYVHNEDVKRMVGRIINQQGGQL